MKKDLIDEIVKKTAVGEKGLRVTLSRIKRRKNLRSIEQAACYYILSHGIGINVSSVIDDRTTTLIHNQRKPQPVETSSSKTAQGRSPKPSLPRIKWMGTHYYSLTDRLTDFYGYLFLYENALRLKINSVMEKQYPNWWETKIKNELPDLYKYAEDRKVEQAKLPMIGQAQVLQPYEHITLSQLEQVVTKYSSLFVPSVFPNLHFFTGHMVIVKRVRNAIAHMSPATTLKDIRHAKNEIDILLHHFSTL
jgi:hypothetical protein